MFYREYLAENRKYKEYIIEKTFKNHRSSHCKHTWLKIISISRVYTNKNLKFQWVQSYPTSLYGSFFLRRGTMSVQSDKTLCLWYTKHRTCLVSFVLWKKNVIRDIVQWDDICLHASSVILKTETMLFIEFLSWDVKLHPRGNVEELCRNVKNDQLQTDQIHQSKFKLIWVPLYCGNYCHWLLLSLQ